MKLAFVIFRYFPFGGLQRDMALLAKAAIAAGHEVTIYCGDWQGEKIADATIIEIPVRKWLNVAGVKLFVEAFQQRFPRANFDLLIGFNKMPGLDVYFAGDTCFARKACCDRGFLYRLAPRTRLYLHYEKEVFGDHSDTGILSLVDTEQRQFAAFYGTPPQRFYRLPPGIDPAHVHCGDPASARAALCKELGVATSNQIILCLGSGFYRKGIDIAIKAFAQLHRSQSDAVLVIAGKDRTEKYRQLTQREGVSKSIFFVGPRNQVGDLLHGVDLLLHPAREELAGNVILEAMLCNCPVLVSACCGYAGYVTQYGLGDEISSLFDISAIAKQLQTLLAVEKTHWIRQSEKFRATGDAFDRMPVALSVLETIAVQKQSPTQKTISTAKERIILRDELVSEWGSLDVFEKVEQLQGNVTREFADRQTLGFSLNNHGYYRKLHRGIGWGEIVKNLVRLRLPILGAVNEWHALNRMQALGIPGPIPVAFGERGKNPATRESFIVTRELSNVIQLDHFFAQRQCAPSIKRKIIVRTAEIARALHGAGINHRDFYLCHFMLDEQSLRGEIKISLMDLHRAQLRCRVPERWLIKDLGGLLFSSLNLGFSRRDFFRFLKVYFAADLRSILNQQEVRLTQILRRARATYKRDFGHFPQL